MELSDTHMKRAISDEEMAGESITEGSKEDIKLQPFISPVNHNTLTSAKTLKHCAYIDGKFLSRRQGQDQSNGRHGKRCLFPDGISQ